MRLRPYRWTRVHESIIDRLLGMPTEHGSKIYKNDQPEIDAGSVMVLRKAGCLIFGKSLGCSQMFSFLINPQAKQPQPSLLLHSLDQLLEMLIALPALSLIHI